MNNHNITIIAEHSVCLDLLPPQANILDAGCRGFEFTRFFKKQGIRIIPCDIDILEGSDYTTVDGIAMTTVGSKFPNPDANHYYRVAISDRCSRAGVVHTKDPQAKYILPGDEVGVFSTQKFKELFAIPHWDLIKLDVEGEEYKILTTGPHPLAKQISVEFHEHTQRAMGKYPLDKLLEELSQYYHIYNQNWESRHGAGYNYWDVLLIAK